MTDLEKLRKSMWVWGGPLSRAPKFQAMATEIVCLHHRVEVLEARIRQLAAAAGIPPDAAESAAPEGGATLPALADALEQQATDADGSDRENS